jgi:sigma-B regulation protein RsbQ
MSGMDIRRRNNVTLTGPADAPVVVLAHGFGCDQNLWRLIVPVLAERYRVVLFDYVGSGTSDLSAWSEERYSSLDGYAQDVAEVCAALDLERAVFVGHSVSAMTGVLAARPVPERIGSLVMVAPSPCYIDDDGYRGGFTAEDIDELLGSLEANYLGWSSAMAPVIMGNPDRPELGEELTNSFCATDPATRRRRRHERPSRLRRSPPGARPAGRRPGRVPAHTGGMLVGALPAVTFTTATTTLAPGETLLLYTDGITALLAARQHALAADADVVLAAVPATLLRVLTLVGLDQVFTLHPGSEPSPGAGRGV